MKKDLEITEEQYATYGTEFISLVDKRLREGEEEYGHDAFLKNDMFQFIAEEMADIVNYCMFAYIKLKLWDEMMRSGDQPEIGPDAFTPTGGDGAS